MADNADLTRLLRDFSSGQRDDVEQLLNAVYEDLRRLAGRQMRDERGDHTLQATALVHETWMRLIDQTRTEWRDRAHFFAVASEMIRRILVDHARRKRAQRRGGERRRVDASAVFRSVAGEQDVDLVALDDALQDLAEISPRQARIVEMRFFGGLTIDEIAEVLDMGRRSVDREWSCARAWLFNALNADGADAGAVSDE